MGGYWPNVIERGLIPPNEPETTECESERSEHLIRRTFKDGHIEWQRSGHDPDGYEQDVTKRVTTDTGTVTWVDNYVPVIVNESLIPREYLCPDMAKLKAAAKAGIEVPGVRRVNEPYQRVTR